MSHMTERQTMVFASMILGSLTCFGIQASVAGDGGNRDKVFVGYLFGQPRNINYRLVHPPLPCVPRGRRRRQRSHRAGAYPAGSSPTKPTRRA